MAANQLAVTVTGSDRDLGDIVLEDLHRFAGSLAESLRAVEARVGPAKLDYRVVDLKHGSCGLVLQADIAADQPDAEPGAPAEVVSVFLGAVEAIAAGRRPDPRLTMRDLGAFRRLSLLTRGRVKSIRFGAEAEVGPGFADRVDELLGKPTRALGTAKGFIKKLDVHRKNRHQFTLYPRLGDPVTCGFAEELYEDVRQALRANVTVHGTLYYYLGDPFPGRADVDRIEVHPPDHLLPTIHDLIGSFREGAGGG